MQVFENLGFLKISGFWKSRVFENLGILKITGFWKSRVFENLGILKITGFWKSRDFENHGFLKIPGFWKSRDFEKNENYMKLILSSLLGLLTMKHSYFIQSCYYVIVIIPYYVIRGSHACPHFLAAPRGRRVGSTQFVGFVIVWRYITTTQVKWQRIQFLWKGITHSTFRFKNR